MYHNTWLVEFDIVLQNDSTESHWLKMTLDSVSPNMPTGDDIQKIYQNDRPDMKRVIVTKIEQIQSLPNNLG